MGGFVCAFVRAHWQGAAGHTCASLWPPSRCHWHACIPVRAPRTPRRIPAPGLAQACSAAFKAVDADAQRRWPERGGTTATLAVVCGWELLVANVGDSCAYLDTGSEVLQASAVGPASVVPCFGYGFMRRGSSPGAARTWRQARPSLSGQRDRGWAARGACPGPAALRRPPALSLSPPRWCLSGRK